MGNSVADFKSALKTHVSASISVPFCNTLIFPFFIKFTFLLFINFIKYIFLHVAPFYNIILDAVFKHTNHALDHFPTFIIFKISPPCKDVCNLRLFAPERAREEETQSPGVYREVLRRHGRRHSHPRHASGHP